EPSSSDVESESEKKPAALEREDSSEPKAPEPMADPDGESMSIASQQSAVMETNAPAEADGELKIEETDAGSDSIASKTEADQKMEEESIASEVADAPRDLSEISSRDASFDDSSLE
ncbi:MAG: hypothetical protein SGARI_004649, partial [Bacillariaceae sp.]